MAELLKGAPVAAAITESLALRAKTLAGEGILPCLAILRIGERLDDLAYEQAAVRRCEKIGIEVRNFVLPLNVTQDSLMETIALINTDTSIHGCLMFRPLPPTLDERAACEALDPKNDVDGITIGSMTKVYSGYGEGYAPCTSQSCLELLRFYGPDPFGRRVTVIGRSLVIGRPVGALLMAADATVTICHTKTRKLPDIVREADIVVVATGRPEYFGPEYFREGQTVLDIGINWSEDKQKLVGDVDFERVEPIVSAISPVPAGVGSVTAAVLCKHVIEAAEKIAAAG